MIDATFWRCDSDSVSTGGALFFCFSKLNNFYLFEKVQKRTEFCIPEPRIFLPDFSAAENWVFTNHR